MELKKEPSKLPRLKVENQDCHSCMHVYIYNFSSRSHLLLRIAVCGTDKVSGAVSNGVLTLCDLAGSERIGKTEATGQRLVEAAAINKSLSALGQVGVGVWNIGCVCVCGGGGGVIGRTL